MVNFRMLNSCAGAGQDILKLTQCLEGYSRDPGFDPKLVRDSGKRKYLDGLWDLTAPRKGGFTKI